MKVLRILVALSALSAAVAAALDPPHDASMSLDCGSCHITHHAPGGAITKVAGNPNLCMSCHTEGGMASAMPFADADEAVLGLSGTSHRWDAGASGWVKAEAANTSTGMLQSGGGFTGRYSKTYAIRITTAGQVGAARFEWTSSKPQTDTYRDNFTAIAFDGTNGTRNWSPSPWLEAGEADGTAAGVVRVASSAACAAGNCLRIGGGSINAISVNRVADITGASASMLTFSYRRQLATCPNNSTANVALQVSANGAAWTTLATYNLNACDNAPVAQGFDITAAIAATTQIRFLGSGTAGASDFLYVDDVQIESVVTAAGTANVTTGTNVALDEGITLTFANGSASPSFQLNDQWTVYATTDINQPALVAVAGRLASGKLTCSACHNQHSQIASPFDPSAPTYAGSGSGEGRHNQRVDNDLNQMCTDCHSVRNVGTAAQGSHPVGIAISGGAYKSPAALPLDHNGTTQCLSCHTLHNSPSADGSLLRMANVTSLCTDCHTLADTASPAAHMNPATGPLWPGPQYGTLFPRVTDTSKRGACTNCHQPHGWPDQSNPSQDFPALLINREENLCYACHDGHPSAKNVLLQFTKSYRHPASDYSGRHIATESTPASFGTTNRHAECGDCHNPHKTKVDVAPPVAPTASSNLLGVARVSVTNGAAGTTPTYTYRAATDTTPAAEYELCFKCHSSWTTRPAGQTDMAVKFNPNNGSFHSVEATGKNTNIRVDSFVNGWTATSRMYCTDCHTSEDPTVRGPHGSQYRYLLKRPFIASSAARTTASTEACFDCHRFATYGTTQSTDTVLANSRFNRPNFEAGHSFHVAEKRAPCYACHDTHGSSTQPHLVVTGRNPGLNSYTETATGGSCSPTCHSPENYTLNYPR